jgi:hypothetical protein
MTAPLHSQLNLILCRGSFCAAESVVKFPRSFTLKPERPPEKPGVFGDGLFLRIHPCTGGLPRLSVSRLSESATVFFTLWTRLVLREGNKL